jgi:acetyltransferase-like isoleucine patch superfamily enzyme
VVEDTRFKFKEMSAGNRPSAAKQYLDLYYGDMALPKAIWAEILFTLLCGMGGAAGLFLRNHLYRPLFKEIGRKVVFGRNVTIRHPQRIRLGDHVILDDNTVIDAKGTTNRGISIGHNVYVGRNTIIYCKNGNIAIGDEVNISSNCQFVSSNDMTIGRDTVIGAYSYLLSGGGYDYTPGAPRFAAQNGFLTSGVLVVGENCWLGAGVIVLDAASIGEHSVVAAGAVVNKPVPAHSVVGGIPARLIKSIESSAT